MKARQVRRRKPKPLSPWGAGIRRVLQDIGVSQVEAIERSGLSQNSLTNLLYGDGRISTLFRLAEGLKVPVQAFFLSPEERRTLDAAKQQETSQIVERLTPALTKIVAEALSNESRSSKGEAHSETRADRSPGSPMRHTFRSSPSTRKSSRSA